MLTPIQRKQKLQLLRTVILKQTDRVLNAIKEDINKEPCETYMTEVGIVLQELKLAIRHIGKWTKPKRVKTSIASFPSKGLIVPEPYGQVLIIAPWNYPFMLSFMPLVGAFAAGNRVVLKPSKKTPKTFDVIFKIISEVFLPSEVVVEGSHDVLYRIKYDYIFFTGGERTGREVSNIAALTLTPLTLELGGKCPAIVDETANIALAAKRLAWGKFLNAGQTCVAPDFIMVHEKVKTAFTNAFVKEIKRQFYVDDKLMELFPRVINESKLHEIKHHLAQENVVFGGKSVGTILEPTVVHADFNSPIMQTEIFAPVAPLLSFNHIEEVLQKLNEMPKALALYYFGKNSEIMRKISFGGGCVNDCVLHVAEHNLPFGGVGLSGMGAYHGKNTFDTFSHYKSILLRGKCDLNFRYSPHTDKKLKTVKKILK